MTCIALTFGEHAAGARRKAETSPILTHSILVAVAFAMLWPHTAIGGDELMPGWPAQLVHDPQLQASDVPSPEAKSSRTSAVERQQPFGADIGDPPETDGIGQLCQGPECQQTSRVQDTVLPAMQAAEIQQPDWIDTSARQFELLSGPASAPGERPGSMAAEKEAEDPADLARPLSGQPSVDRTTGDISGTAANLADHNRPAATAPPADDRKAVPDETVPDQDPIALMQQQLLASSGLLARQSEISESIILMEQQLKQAELITRLITILGPDTPIEILPGEYRSYRNTPAGERISAENALRKAQAQAQLVRMQMELVLAEAELRQAASSTAVYATPPVQAAETPRDPVLESGPVAPITLIVHEISGQGSELEAIVEWDGERHRVRTGSIIGDGAEIVSIDAEAVEIVDGGRESRIEVGY